VDILDEDIRASAGAEWPVKLTAYCLPVPHTGMHFSFHSHCDCSDTLLNTTHRDDLGGRETTEALGFDRMIGAHTILQAFSCQLWSPFWNESAGYGWSWASSVGVGDMYWPIAPSNRGRWGFATLPAFRGSGIYPRLLQPILRREEHEAEKGWIGHRADSSASQRGGNGSSPGASLVSGSAASVVIMAGRELLVPGVLDMAHSIREFGVS
jgi:hypothetical protein